MDLFNHEIFSQGTSSTSAGSTALSGGAAVNPARCCRNQNAPNASVSTAAGEAAPVPVAQHMSAGQPTTTVSCPGAASALPAATSLGPATIDDTISIAGPSGPDSISGAFTATNLVNHPPSYHVATPPSPPMDIITNSQSSTSIHDMCASSVTISTSSIQVDLEKMTISNTKNPTAGSATTARQVSSCKVAPPSTVPTMIPDLAAASQQPGNLLDKLVQPAIGCTTRALATQKGKAANV
ncbi:hypothetical protein OG21DRAFT_1482557 [Imleria badia]|nr:hypothetical protein OG21DRAFT_1482557 [Imleria badia]